MYALENPKVGQVVVSRMGHDKQRVYLIVAVLGGDFVLCADGKYRTLDNPKPKRLKHLGLVGECEATAKKVASGKVTDAALRKTLGEWKSKLADDAKA